jgi:hypothetical protein
MDAEGRATLDAKAEFIEINEHFERTPRGPNLTTPEQVS